MFYLVLVQCIHSRGCSEAEKKVWPLASFSLFKHNNAANSYLCTMTENDLFNRDAMFWREINFSSPGAIAELDLQMPVHIDGEELKTLVCSLLPFETHSVEHDLGEGGSFLKNEVKQWPFVLLADLEYYKNEANSEADRQAKVQVVLHANVQCITLKDASGKLIVKKGKI